MRFEVIVDTVLEVPTSAGVSDSETVVTASPVYLIKLCVISFPYRSNNKILQHY